jgi:hypothetical protein
MGTKADDRKKAGILRLFLFRDQNHYSARFATNGCISEAFLQPNPHPQKKKIKETA